MVMIRSFWVLWVAVFLPILLLSIPTQFNPIPYLSRSISEEFYKPVYQSNFTFLSEKLRQAPQAEWTTIIDGYAKHFSYPLRLEALDSYHVSPEVYQALQKGEIIFQDGDPMALLQRVLNSDKVLYFAINEPREPAALNQSRGTLYLAVEDLRSQPRTQWQTSIAEQNSRIPLELSLLQEQDLSPIERSKLLADEEQMTSYINQQGSMILLAAVDENTWLRVEDNISYQTQLKLTTAIGGFFFLAISVALVMWIYPLWRDLKRLVKTANEFGQGVLSRRATTSRLSVVSQLSHSFNNMANNIEKLIASQRTLTNAVAHDLRTPLYRLRFAFEMLEDEDIALSQKEKYRQVIHSSIEDLDHLINQTLVLSRYNRITDIRHFSYCHFADNLVAEAEHFQLENPQLTLRVSVLDSLRQQTIFVDNRALLRAVKNLLSNAARFAQQEIHLSLNESDGQLFLVVEDDGPGIAPDDIERIFEPFTQVNNQERNSEKGHGLGLAIVKQITRWHQGKVRVKVNGSALGGACFELQWPKQISLPNVTKLDTNGQ
ncbi:two-component sensor histidine kinase [Vibrio sp. V09_P4A23P171]|uniref:ATP-binding protein n=1 Tax=Vibrio sp. V09_P4A23P171 TaxID=1938664 RepID=UPI000B8E7698|nr:ATP-binding protein [Vibrio sp. V09_P4A23P171]OXX38201.1 two-component sensor histidine kinase [Vibrio sp. V09_P4A23P171]